MKARIFLMLLLLSWWEGWPALAATSLRVGIYDNPPLVYRNQEGKASGFSVEILRKVAKKEAWDLKFLHATWQENLDRLQRGEIDLLVNIAYSEDRDTKYDFNRENLMVNWGQVYSASPQAFASLLDLNHKRVALMEGSIHSNAFLQNSQQFDLQIEPVLLKSYDEVLLAVSRGLADAGVVNRVLGKTKAPKLRVFETPIVFNPIELRYAFPHGKSEPYATLLDLHLKEMKEDPDSAYHLALNRVLGQVHKDNSPPRWAVALMVASLLLLVTTLALSWWLKRQVALRTKELEQQKRHLEAEVETRERMQKELILAKSRAEQASRAKSNFLAVMSHELRTPLNGVLGLAELLLMMPQEQKTQKYVRSIFESGQALMGILNEILEIVQLDAGELPLRPSQVRLADLLNRQIRLFASAASAKDNRLESMIDSELPESLQLDAGKTGEIISNLLGNAIKFTQQGKISLRLLKDKVENNQIWLRIEVEDTGIGIDPKDQSRIFEPFTQVDESSTREYSGAGLGLAVVAQITRRMQGTHGVISAPQRGSLFWVSLPCPQTEEQKTRTEDKTPCARDSSQGRLRILVAEDDSTNQLVLQEMLDSLDCEIMIASNGLEVLEILQKHQFHAILMDCRMPLLDGLEATKKIRTLQKEGKLTCRPVIIALTAKALAGDREDCLNAGMDDYLPKPVARTDLALCLARWCQPE